MSALVYENEIREQRDCGECAQSKSLWNARGRCLDKSEFTPYVSAKRKGKNGEEVTVRHEAPVVFESCPLAMMRLDICPDEIATARLTLQAKSAGLKRAYPNLPNKLWELLLHLEGLRLEKKNAIQKLYMEDV